MLISKDSSKEQISKLPSLRGKGYFGGEYEVSLSPYKGADFSKIGFIFPGQGAPVPGMFREELDNLSCFQERFHFADQYAKERGMAPISNYIAKPESIPEEQFAGVRTLCLYTSAIALYDRLLELGIYPHVNIGHSYGEIAAFVASGMSTFEGAFEALYHREATSPPAHSVGYMIVALASPEKLLDLLSEFDVYIGNINTPEQSVLACRAGEVGQIQRTLRKARIVSRILDQVPQPYHSPMIEDVAEAMNDFQKEKGYVWQPPKVAFASWVYGKLVDKDNFDRHDFDTFFRDVMTRQVDFPAQLKLAREAGCASFLELSPHAICGLFARDIFSGERVRILRLDKYIKSGTQDKKLPNISSDNKFVQMLSQAVSAVTGYEIEEVKIQDRFQDDLGIDSLKKTEIIFRVLNESGLDSERIAELELEGLAEVKTLAETAEYLEKILAQPVTKKKKSAKAMGQEFERCIPVWEKTGIAGISRLKPTHRRLISVRVEDLLLGNEKAVYETTQKLVGEALNLQSDDSVALILSSDLQMSEYSEEKLLEDVESLLVPFAQNLVIFARALSALNTHRRLSVVLVIHPETHPYIAGLASALKSIKKEMDLFTFKCISLAEKISAHEADELVNKELCDLIDVDVRYQHGEREVLRYRPVPAQSEEVAEAQVVMAIGGAKGIALETLKGISERQPTHLYVCGRSNEHDVKVQEGLQALRELCESIEYIQLDARQCKDVISAAQRVVQEQGRLDELINAAGQEVSKALLERSKAEIEQEMLSKFLPTLSTLAAARAVKPKRVVQYSSVSGPFGNAGQAVYSFCNHAISHMFSAFRTQNPQVATKVLHWGPWDNVGMTANMGILMRLKSFGVTLLKPDVADRLLKQEWHDNTSTEVAFIPPLDLMRMRFELLNSQVREKILGEPKDPRTLTLSRLIGMKTDPYLKDHQVHKVCLLPAAEAMAIFYHLGSLPFAEVASLKEFRAHNMLKIDEEAKPVELTCSFAKEGVDVRLSTEMKNFSCRMVSEPMHAAEISVEFSAKKFIDPDSMYAPTCIDFGPTFQHIHEGYVNEAGQAYAVVYNSKLPSLTGVAEYDRFIQWTDAAFQALSCEGIVEQCELGVPTKVALLQFDPDQEVTDKLIIIPHAEEIKAGSLKGQVTVYNANGRPLVHLEGVEMATVRNFETMPLVIRDL